VPPQTQAMTLRQVRQHFLDHGQCPDGSLDERLARSWMRSQAAGLRPTGRLGHDDILAPQRMGDLVAQHHTLLAHSRPVMEYLFDQVKSTQSVVLLAAPCGTLVHAQGDPHFLSKAERVALQCGASWREEQRGTNAIGTALAEGQAVEVRGGEHYLDRNGFLTCAAAPILSARGELLGVLDISGEHHRGGPFTLGLVSTAARMIENRLLLAQHPRQLRMHLHAHAEGLGTVAEGLVLLSDDGWLMGANRAALELLGLLPGQLGNSPWANVSDTSWADLMSSHVPGQVQVVRLHGGRQVFVQVHVDTQTWRPALPRAFDTAAGRRATRPLSDDIDALSRLDSGDPRWRQAADKARRVVHRGIPLLIQGESGVGKEWFARASHESGPRQGKPFVAINCAALPEHLIEAELFGYASGAFTGARKEGRRGLLREANGGTLFLDEVGDMPLGMQARLLRVLQEKEVVPVGAEKPVPVDFALVAATNRCLIDRVNEGLFRSDLYYRLNGLSVELPALRERADLPALVAQILRKIEPSRDLTLAPELLAELCQHTWPGNLRQCSSVLRTACAMMDADELVIQRHHLADDFIKELARTQRVLQATSATSGAPPQNLDELSRVAVQQALESARGNVSLAARTLGISRQTLYRKLEEARRQAP
jgi:sigma-54 dependent transcriptional regulator, acetoin dehydrogenase operon transcriptional activator AcoR